MMASGNSQATPESGFTLIEMLLVLGLLGLMATLTLPLTRRQAPQTSLKATTLQLASLMRTARGAAIHDNAEKRLVLDGPGRRFWIEGVTGAHAIPSGVNVGFAAPGSPIRFFADGSSSGGRATLAAGGRTAQIALDALTAQPRIIWRP